eukprot:5757880-Prymnesium_polylepis.1
MPRDGTRPPVSRERPSAVACAPVNHVLRSPNRVLCANRRLQGAARPSRGSACGNFGRAPSTGMTACGGGCEGSGRLRARAVPL